MKNILTQRVLLLNFSYEPLGTVGVARAVCMEINKKAYVEEYDGNNVLHSQRESFRVPSVIRLKTYVNVRKRRRETQAKRTRIYIRDRYRCQYCAESKKAGELTLDHILPKAQGGENVADNLVTACFPCNQRKGNRTPEQARMPLLTTQEKLKVGLDTILLSYYAESNPVWARYLGLEDEKEDVVGIINRQAA